MARSSPDFHANLKRFEVPYCARNGCGRPNGAAMARPMTCMFCGHVSDNQKKRCPKCGHCMNCGRISKRAWDEMWNDYRQVL